MVLLVSCADKTELPTEITDDVSDEQPRELSEFEQRLASLEAFETQIRTEIINRYHPYPTYELIPGDYGKLYPFPGFAMSEWNVLYGLMTADGRVVLDAMFEFVWFIDVGGGYYRTHRLVPAFLEDDYGYWETRYIAADGSRELILSEHASYSAMLKDETVRVIEIRDKWEENGWENRLVGVLDMDGNIISPFEHVEDNYAVYSFGGAQFEDALYVNRHTGEHFFFFGGAIWVGHEGGEYLIEYARVTEAGGIEARFIYTPSINATRSFIRDGISLAIGDYIIIRDPYAEDEVRHYDDFVHVIAHLSVVLTDSAGNIIKTFPEGIFFYGDLLYCVETKTIYDYDLNIIDFGEYSLLYYHLEDDVYIFMVAGYWDEDGMWFDEWRALFVDIKDGRRVEAKNVYPYTLSIIAPGLYSDGNVMYNLNTGEVVPYTPSLLPAGEIIRLTIFDDGYMGVVDENGEWLIKINMLNFISD
jgi:hypothetical protein